MLLGFSSGCFYKISQDLNEQIKLVSDTGCNAIEVSMFTFCQPEDLTEETLKLLSKFEYISIHAPNFRKLKNENVEEAKRFVKLTGCNSLAVAIGTSHGPYKFKGGSKLDFKRLKELRKNISVPLVLHGASSIPQKVIKKAEKYGAELGNAHGVSDAHLRKAVKLGICKVNTDSDLRLMFDAAIREELTLNPKVYDPRTILTHANEAIYNLVKEKIKILGSAGKA